MSLMSRLRGTDYSEAADPGDEAGVPLEEQVQSLSAELAFVTEAAAEIERLLAHDDQGWLKLAEGTAGTFTRQQLRDITTRCRLGQWNALIGRGLGLRAAYVHGAGVSIAARAVGGDGGQQDVNAVVQAFLDANPDSFGPVAREECERALGTDGNLFWACFTNPVNGTVTVRDVPWDQIDDVVRGDDGDPKFYLRRWTEPATPGGPRQERKVYYPDLRYRPSQTPVTVDGIDVQWDAPVLHILVNRPTRQAKFGVPDAFRAVAWATSYKEFLEDWAKLVRSLSKLAWRASSKGTSQARARDALGRATAPDAPVGQAAVFGPDTVLEAIPKTGATIDSESGRPLAAMVASGLGVPVTMLLGDPGTVGSRATAETLDRPTEDMAGMRQDVWTQAYRLLLGYVVDQAVLAPRGALTGSVSVDDFGREVVTLAGDTDRTVDVVWPDLTETPVNVIVDAIGRVADLRLAPPLLLLRLLLQALGVDDVDEIVAQVTDPATGEFMPPTYPTTTPTPAPQPAPPAPAPDPTIPEA